MKNKTGVLLLILFILTTNSFTQQSNSIKPEATAAEPIIIKSTNKTALLDGRCGNDEWDVATKIELAAGASIYLMHDEDYFYFCACGKAEDYTILDLYIEHAETGRLHKFHLSAQMGESVLTEDGWKNESGKWNLIDYAGFWVPYSGLEDVEKRIGPKFAKGTHRQMQISRKKFAGTTWNMMFGVGGIKQEGDGGRLLYPEKAIGEDKSTWRKFSFSE
jgi:hypothetical protein